MSKTSDFIQVRERRSKWATQTGNRVNTRSPSITDHGAHIEANPVILAHGKQQPANLWNLFQQYNDGMVEIRERREFEANKEAAMHNRLLLEDQMAC